MSRSGGAPAGDRGARGTTGTTCLGRRKQDTAASQAAVGIVAIEAGIDPHILPAPLRTADLRQFRLDGGPERSHSSVRGSSADAIG